ncbi:protein SRG1-like isoform X4 [Syzygium oleosum]|uniref:protein SRG1-like isoform X4 n=1 Tax=Syzygium oleosum TaxID=219896 RepID=UPI0024BA4594|nr:protein SRG1-like isoform X4 [Syzygium oleosum]
MACETKNWESVTFPVVDISLLSSEDELQKLKSVLSSCGCFQAVGHGISIEYLDKVREIAQQFFALPVEEKQKYSRASNEAEGYGDDLVVNENQVKDCCYRLFLKVLPENQRRMNLWPENPADLWSLELEENSFLDQFGDQPGLEDKEVEGLQVLKDGMWQTVPVIPHALVVNLGGLMQVMTNGMFKSPLHRVLTNANKLRMSIAVFDEPEAEKEIGPVNHLVDHMRPRLYRSVRNFAAFNYECFQKGKDSLEELRI